MGEDDERAPADGGLVGGGEAGEEEGECVG